MFKIGSIIDNRIFSSIFWLSRYVNHTFICCKVFASQYAVVRSTTNNISFSGRDVKVMASIVTSPKDFLQYIFLCRLFKWLGGLLNNVDSFAKVKALHKTNEGFILEFGDFVFELCSCSVEDCFVRGISSMLPHLAQKSFRPNQSTYIC